MLQTTPHNFHFPIKINKKETLVGQKIKDGLKRIEGAILAGDIDNSLFYCFDFILTGNYETVIQKLCSLYISHININNLAFFEILFDEYYKIIIAKKDLKTDYIKLINNQEFRNHMTFLITMLCSTSKSKVSFDDNYLRNTSKNLLQLDPIYKLKKINSILSSNTISQEDETNLYNYTVSLANQHDDNFYKSCSIKTISIDYLINVWDIILRNSTSSRLKEIRKYILIGFNLYTKCFKDVSILLFIMFLVIHDVNKDKIETDMKQLIKYQLTINDFLNSKFRNELKK
jgi:hypothetical protein